MHRRLVIALAIVSAVIGVALIVQTARVGGTLGYLVGTLFVGLGLGRLYLVRRR